jgi:hypothetical protein
MNSYSIANQLTNGYRMMVVVVAVVTVMPIWLRKCAGRKERKQDKYQIFLHVLTVTKAHKDCLSYNALI